MHSNIYRHSPSKTFHRMKEKLPVLQRLNMWIILIIMHTSQKRISLVHRFNFCSWHSCHVAGNPTWHWPGNHYRGNFHVYLNNSGPIIPHAQMERETKRVFYSWLIYFLWTNTVIVVNSRTMLFVVYAWIPWRNSCQCSERQREEHLNILHFLDRQ